jgi:hypothetical protein
MAMQRRILIICLFLAPPLLLFYSVKDNFYRHFFTYLVIALWLIAAILILNKKKATQNRFLVLSHFVIAIIGLVGIIDNYLYDFLTLKKK